MPRRRVSHRRVRQASRRPEDGGTCEVCVGVGHDGEDVPRSLSVVAAHVDLVNVGAGLRTIIAGFCMLVGICCWGKAFETQPSSHGLHNNPVIGTTLVARLLPGCVAMLARPGTGTASQYPEEGVRQCFA